MKNKKQLELIPQKTNQRFFGGALLKGRRKGMRPLARGEAMHFVMRSLYASGKSSFRQPRNLRAIQKILDRSAKKYGVKIYRQAIQSNHIHLIIRITNRQLYRAFISVITGKIATQVMNGMSFKNFQMNFPGVGPLAPELPPHQGQAFWEYRPFHRILSWGRDYASCCLYLAKNKLEALGFIAYQPRKKNYLYAKLLLEKLPQI